MIRILFKRMPMTNPYNFLTDCDPVEMDLRLNASLGKPFDFSSGNFDPIEIDRRIATTPPPPPPGPTPSDYTYGSINYKDEFATVPVNSIQVRDGKVLISFKAKWETHGLFCFCMYVPEEFFKILAEYDTGRFTARWQAGDITYLGEPLETMSMFLWDPSRDFSNEPIQVYETSAFYYATNGVLLANQVIDVPPDLIRTFYGYQGADDLRFEKTVWHSLKQFSGGVWNSPDLIALEAFFDDYNETPDGAFATALNNIYYNITVDPQKSYPAQKQVVMTPPMGLSYIFSGLRSPLGYQDAWASNTPFKNSWKYDGTDGELGRVAAGQPFPQDVADRIPTEWNTL